MNYMWLLMGLVIAQASCKSELDAEIDNKRQGQVVAGSDKSANPLPTPTATDIPISVTEQVSQEVDNLQLIKEKPTFNSETQRRALGWIKANNQPQHLPFSWTRPTEMAQNDTVLFMCKSVPKINVTQASVVEWKYCDGDQGLTQVFKLQRNDSHPDGYYVHMAKAVIKRADKTYAESSPEVFENYMHRSLNNAVDCSFEKTAADVANAVVNNPSIATVHSFGVETILNNPAIKIEWANGQKAEYLSLRKKFERVSAGNMDFIVVSRDYESKMNPLSCKKKLHRGKIDGDIRREHEFIVFNADGRGIGITLDGNGTLTYSTTGIDYFENMQNKMKAKQRQFFSKKSWSEEPFDPDAETDTLLLPR